MAICDWPVERRPRERLLAEGPEALLDAELLAVLLRTGVEGKDAIELGRELLVRFGGINGLLSAGRELLGVKGLGQAKAAQFAAAMELARRAMREELAPRAGLTSPGAVRDYLRIALGHRPHEVFVCIWLDAQHKVVGVEEAFRGTLTQTSVYPREIVKKALARNAAAVIFAQNRVSFGKWLSKHGNDWRHFDPYPHSYPPACIETVSRAALRRQDRDGDGC